MRWRPLGPVPGTRLGPGDLCPGSWRPCFVLFRRAGARRPASLPVLVRVPILLPMLAPILSLVVVAALAALRYLDGGAAGAAAVVAGAALGLAAGVLAERRARAAPAPPASETALRLGLYSSGRRRLREPLPARQGGQP